MSFKYIENYFMASMPNISNNPNIRQPQLEAYTEIYNYFSSNNYEDRSAIVVLPTGVGKTGVMGLAPFHICKKRTLIITPGSTIRDTVLDNLDPFNPDNFWYKRKIFKNDVFLPNVIEYDGLKTPDEVLNSANIVILNVQKLQARLDSSLLNRVDKDFFDFIIIDEAHHSVASTWVDCIEHFKAAKVLKLTGTPFRTDNEPLVGKLIYKYPLSRAMSNNYVKSLSNIQYVPDLLKLTIDKNDSKLYTIDELYSLNLRDQDWISRSVALSEECSESIVVSSINHLKDKKLGSTVPHKIIAIACSIEHAKQIAVLYEKHGIKTAIVHSGLSDEDKDIAFKNIETHRVEAVIHVAMLGEGYDHRYLSIAAIFRPFRNELPYTQFIGRILRYIPEGNAKDNVGIVISHKHLFLDKLWEKYKKEIQESEVISSLKYYDDLLDEIFNSPDEPSESTPRDSAELGSIVQSSSHTLQVEDYLTTELLKKSREDDAKMQEQIKQIMSIIPNISEDQAKLFIQQTQSSSSALGRPDLLYKSRKKNLDTLINEEFVPSFIEKYNIDIDNDDLRRCGLFDGKYWWIPNRIKRKKGANSALLAMYYNAALKNKIGRKRDDWTQDDYDLVFNSLESLNQLIEGFLKRYYNK